MKSSRTRPDSHRRERSSTCWCGNGDLKPFSDDYLRCSRCETLVLRRMPTKDVTRVRDDSADLYGRNYYLKHLQQDFGYPDLKTRARTDLPERCLYWLRTTLKYKIPPGNALELGSAHGAFVALLRWTGFGAKGLELSPWLVNFAKGVFDVPMLSGPIEDQRLAPRSLDVIALMDVLEHLPSPLATMKRCLSLLKKDGVLVIQTPQYPEAGNYEEMVARRDPFLEQLKSSDHLYLYSQKSVRKLLRQLGAGHVAFEPAIFAHYDMFLVASSAPLSITPRKKIEAILSATPASRLIQALLDTDDRLRDLQERLRVSDADRAARLDVIHQQGRQATELEAEVHRWLEETKKYSAQAQQLEGLRAGLQAEVSNLETERRLAQARLTELQRLLETSEADRAARLENNQRLEQLLGESERDRTARLGIIQTQGAQLASLDAQLTELQQLLETSEADRVARLVAIQAQGAQVASLDARLTELQQLLETSEADRAARLGVIQNQTAQVASLHAQLAELHQSLESSEAAGVAHSEEINKQRQMLEKADSKHKRLQAEISYSKTHAGAMHDTLQQLRHSHTYRITRALGSWRSLDRSIAAIAGTELAAPHPSSDGPQKKLRRVVVDLTPVLPGADNGGAKLIALELVRRLAQLASSCEWVLLTSEKGHADLASLDSHNVRRVCVGADDERILGTSRRPAGGLSRLGKWFKSSSRRSLLRELGPDIVFCPFTTARFFDPRVPMVTIVHDLQYLTYPEWFSQEERAHRDREFRNVCRFATRVICISDYVRGTVLQHGTVDSSQVTTIYNSLFHRLADSKAGNDADVLSRFGLQADRFLLYPANYWPHKNHEMLLTAFGMYRARHPESDLKLVCTGGLSARREELQEAGARMGFNGQVILTEFVPDEEFAMLLRACRALVFPSLFEGFGMPVLEAMAFDKPVLCSNVTSLPEVVGDAALLFDPRKPAEIVHAIEQVESDSELVAQLIQSGRNRLAVFDDAAGMARRYLQVIQDALNGDNHFTLAIHGVFSDGWTGDHMTVTHNPSGTQRYLEITLYAPPWLPSETLAIRVGAQTDLIKRDQTVTLRYLLSAASGSVEMQIHPTFRPQAHQLGADTRMLGCLCRSCRILSPDETVELFAEVPQA